MMGGDDVAQSSLIVFGRKIPIVCLGKLRVVGAFAGVCHALQPQISAVSKDGSEHCVGVIMLLA